MIVVLVWFLKVGFSVVQVNHEDFNEGIIQVQAKKKASLNYYAWSLCHHLYFSMPFIFQLVWLVPSFRFGSFKIFESG